MPHDQFVRCHCGHQAGHHAVDEPWPCRLCDCEGFITQKELDRLNEDDGLAAERGQRPHFDNEGNEVHDA